MRATGWLVRSSVVVLLIVMTPSRGSVQDRQGLVTIAAMGIDESRQWDEFVDRLVHDGSLMLQTAYDDSEIPGRRHEGFAQYHRGVRVYGGDATRQIEGGVTVSIFGNVYTDIDVDPTPQFAMESARNTLAGLTGTTSAEAGEPTLVILPTLDGRLALVYRVSMRNGITYFLDAGDGRVLMEVDEVRNQIAVGTGRGALGDLKKVSAIFSGTVYRARDGLRPAPVLTIQTGSGRAAQRLFEGGLWLESDLADDADNNWTQAAVVDAHVHMGWTYDYFFTRHSYQGLNNRNGSLIGVVTTREVLPSNAFYVPPPYGPNGGGGMFSGETTSGSPLTVLDVIAHELMHGVTFFAVSQRTGKQLGPSFLLERGPNSIVIGGQTYPCLQSTIEGIRFFCDGGSYVLAADHAGAINEGVSDIFGTAVEFAYQPAGAGLLKAEYTIAEDLPEIGLLARNRSGALRSLEDPASLIIEGQPLSGIGYPDHYSRRINVALVELPNGALALSKLAFVGDVPVILGSADGGAVHWNSTILSHAFYLAVEGGRNRTSGRTVQGVGAANRAQIERAFFRALRNGFPSAVSFRQAGVVVRQAAVDLFGSASTAATAIDQALAAVGL